MQIKVLGGIKPGTLQLYGEHLKHWANRKTLIKKSWMEMNNHVSMKTLLQTHNTFHNKCIMFGKIIVASLLVTF